MLINVYHFRIHYPFSSKKTTKDNAKLLCSLLVFRIHSDVYSKHICAVKKKIWSFPTMETV